MSPQAKRFMSMTGAVIAILTIVAFSAGAAKGIFDAGIGVQDVKASVSAHGRRLDTVEAKIDGKADVGDVRESEARIKEAMRESVDVLRQDIRELRQRR